MRRIIVLTSILLVAFAALLISRDSRDARLKNASRGDERNGWIPVHLEGTPSEIGYQHGYLLAPEIQDAVRDVSF